MSNSQKQLDLLDRMPSYQKRKRINQSIKATFPGVEHLGPGEWLSIEQVDPRDELEFEIAERIANVRKYHNPDAALNEAMDILDEVLDAFDREVASAYKAGRDDERSTMNNELFKVRVEAFGQGVDCALKHMEENE
jgi:hypothetical protein